MKANRPFAATVVAVLAVGLAATGWAAPAKRAKHSKTPVTKPTKPLPGLTPLPAAPVADTPAPTAAPGDVMLYDGRAPSEEGLSLAPWGGGLVEDSHDISFSKGHALKVTTLDPYQGARLSFATPVALGDVSDKTRYLALTVRLGAVTRTITQPANSRQPGGFPYGGRGRGGRRGAAPGATQSFVVSGQSSLQGLHLTFTLAGGAQTDFVRPMPDAQSGQGQWVTVAVPLSAFAPSPGGALQSVTLAGDDYAVLYVGQMRLTQDATPITGFAGDQQNVSVGQPVTLQGTASGGLSALQFSWDFDDRDGITEQATGPSVATAYLKPDTYKVTLTVSDLDGLKKPVTSTTEVRVQ